MKKILMILYCVMLASVFGFVFYVAIDLKSKALFKKFFVPKMKEYKLPEGWKLLYNEHTGNYAIGRWHVKYGCWEYLDIGGDDEIKLRFTLYDEGICKDSGTAKGLAYLYFKQNRTEDFK